MTMILKQWLLSQNPSPHLPKAGPLRCIFLTTLESGQLSKKHIKKASKCIHIDFKEILQFRYPATTLIVTNALMMTSPLEALAQTCEADTSSVFNMPLLLLVALVGATVGGLVARQRKAELQRLNEQLRQINAALRRQAKIESYAPSLSYAPVGAKIAESEVIVDPRKEELIYHLKNGKNFLRNQAPEKAFVEFKTALELAQNVNDPIEEKKAARGLGASLQRQGKYKEAIEYHSMVLDISSRNGEDSGSTEAYGAIADCYTELGDMERAAKYYDQYIARLQSD
ncbi:protein FLUORESCENT IN BLUE LIGHT, chloroplastic-like [Nicotiana sylvestris]|uniref:Protein FLUORESCENT IN BLUE LIGHT, chloroplastic-like isoform X1 n=1 Tax=Nicotiana sylvestris TaxID=4096 RepID=A0A1U7WLM6_NICSY|nr:PREDICTED: protein FLUORESCENT IN BLUE LIGHT, chloroplastic-like isoform X1 [Nicotiana sylvestris]